MPVWRPWPLEFPQRNGQFSSIFPYVTQIVKHNLNYFLFITSSYKNVQRQWHICFWNKSESNRSQLRCKTGYFLVARIITL